MIDRATKIQDIYLKTISQNNSLCFVITIFKVHSKRQKECER